MFPSTTAVVVLVTVAITEVLQDSKSKRLMSYRRNRRQLSRFL
jgi:hypothetical protein